MNGTFFSAPHWCPRKMGALELDFALACLVGSRESVADACVGDDYPEREVFVLLVDRVVAQIGDTCKRRLSSLTRQLHTASFAGRRL